MGFSIGNFESLPPKKKLEFLKSEEFQNLEEKGEYILASLKESFPPLKAYAIKLAGMIGLINEELLVQFLSDPNPVVRDSANKVLESIQREKFEEKSFREEAEKILLNGEKEAKINLIEKIKGREDKWATDILLGFLEDTSWEVRNSAVKALTVREDIDIQSLLSLLKKSQWFVKSCVLELMGNKKLEVISQEVIDLKKDPNLEVKLKLIEFFKRIGGEEVLQHLVDLSKDPHSWVRKSAQNAMNELKKTFISSIFSKKEL